MRERVQNRKLSTERTIQEAINDPNLTKQERKRIEDIHLRALRAAQKRSAHYERGVGDFETMLYQELEKDLMVIEQIRGRAAIRSSRQTDNY